MGLWCACWAQRGCCADGMLPCSLLTWMRWAAALAPKARPPLARNSLTGPLHARHSLAHSLAPGAAAYFPPRGRSCARATARCSRPPASRCGRGPLRLRMQPTRRSGRGPWRASGGCTSWVELSCGVGARCRCVVGAGVGRIGDGDSLRRLACAAGGAADVQVHPDGATMIGAQQPMQVPPKQTATSMQRLPQRTAPSCHRNQPCCSHDRLLLRAGCACAACHGERAACAGGTHRHHWRGAAALGWHAHSGARCG